MNHNSRPELSEADGAPVVSPRLGQRLGRVATQCAFVTSFIGLVVLTGWVFGWLRLTYLWPGFTPMRPNVALGLLMAGGALALLARPSSKKARLLGGQILAVLVLTLGLLTAAQYLFGIALGIDEWIAVVQPTHGPTQFPSRMSPITTFCFIGVGLGLIFLNGRHRSVTLVSEIATLAAMLAALVGLMGYAYGVSAFYSIGSYSAIAVHTAFAFLVLGTGILVARPGRGLVSLLVRDTSGSIMARRLLLAAFLVPLALGWFHVRSERLDYFELHFATALLVAALVAIFVALIWSTAVSLDRMELARQGTETALRESEGRYRSLFDSIDEGFCVIEVIFDRRDAPVDYRFLEINPAFEKQSGLKDALGRTMREFAPDQDPHWFELYGKVVRTQHPIRHEAWFPSLQRWFNVFAFPVGQPAESKVAVLFSDVTARRTAEAALRASVTSKTAILESALDCIIAMDREGRITEWNPAAERTFGHSRGQVLGKRLADLIIPERFREAHWRGLAHFLETGQGRLLGKRVEVSALRADRSEIPVELSIAVSEGDELFFTAYLRDITERKRAEQDLQRTGQLLDTMVRFLPAGVALIRGSDLTFELVNPGYQSIAPGKPMVGKTIYDVWPETMPLLADRCRRVLETGQPFSILDEPYHVSRTIDGPIEPLYFSWSLHRVSLPGGTDSLLITVWETTDRKQSEVALRESEARFRALGENIAHLAWMADAGGAIFWYNKRWYDYTGTTLEEMQGWGWEKVHDPEHLPHVLATWNAALARGDNWEDIFPLRGKDGRYGWFLSRAFPLRNSEGKITGWFGTNTDITELRETQQELQEAQGKLQQHANNLEQTVAERTAALQETIGELEAFSYSLSHDLRGPLRAIQSFSQLALEDCGETGADYLGRVLKNARRLDRMILDVLSYTRISRADIQLVSVDVDRLVRDISAERPELHEPLATLVIESPLLPVLGHEASLTQVLTNLLGNAVKFVAPGVKPRVRIYNEDLGDTVRLWIEDNGIGIAPESQAKVFQLFSREHAPGTYEGTGIGLAIVRKAVDRMGGQIGLESVPGKGSRFCLILRNAL